jgi:molecular chaperone DnaJ
MLRLLGLQIKRFASTASPSFYDVLSVPKEATITQIKKAFLEVAKRYHPDTNKDLEAPKKFIEAKRAYDTLSDPEKRKVYDMTGSEEEAHAYTQEPREQNHDFQFKEFYNNFTNFDIFNELFQGSQPRDIEVSVTLDFLEACKGSRRTVTIDRLKACPACKGRGYSSTVRTECSKCKGRGVTTEIKGGFIFSSPCRSCQGTGRSTKDVCSDCKGAAQVRQKATVDVNFPPGIGCFHVY